MIRFASTLQATSKLLTNTFCNDNGLPNVPPITLEQNELEIKEMGQSPDIGDSVYYSLLSNWYV